MVGLTRLCQLTILVTMKRAASVVQLKAKLSEYLRFVKAGREIVVTERNAGRGGDLLEVLFDDVRVRLESGTDVAYVARLVDALRRPC